MNILFFTDAHDTPKDNHKRFEKLSKLIADRQPDYVVQGGDFSSFESLSHFDRNKARLKEGRRLRAELDSRGAACAALWSEVRKLQHRQRMSKQRLYSPGILWMYGNHDVWLDNYMETYPEMDGLVSLTEIDTPTISCEFQPLEYKEEEGHSKTIHGINFTHAIQGKTGPVSSKYICERAFDYFESSVVFGHSHILQLATKTRVNDKGKHLQHKSWCGGCFFDTTPTYSVGHTNDYSKGVTWIRSDEYGQFNPQWISLEELYHDY